MIKSICGIDPGAMGGVAVVRDGIMLAGIRMPTLKKGKRVVVDSYALNMWLTDEQIRPDIFVIEAVGAMPAQGVSSSFNFGRMAGGCEAWALSFGVPVHWVTPAKWKPAVGLSKDKQASLDLAATKFGRDPRWDVKRNDGIAEAAIMAQYWADRN